MGGVGKVLVCIAVGRNANSISMGFINLMKHEWVAHGEKFIFG